MAVAAYREKAVTVCTIETLTHIRFKGVNVTNVENVNVNTSITWHRRKAQRELTRFTTFQVNHQKKEVFLDKYIQI